MRPLASTAVAVATLAAACTSASVDVAPHPAGGRHERTRLSTTTPRGPVAEPAPQAPATKSEPGTADTDPSNDEIVAPPDTIEHCDQALDRAGIRYRPATLAMRTQRSGAQCGAPQVVIYQRGPGDIRYDPPPLLTCGMALALGRFEHVIQEEAQRILGQRVARIRQMGTFACRKMVRFRMVSEHSYANAIDLEKLVLLDRRVISVHRHYGDSSAGSPESRFLQTIARRAYDDGIFSVALGPPWDKLHANHLHLDLARYRVNGTLW